MKTGKKHIKNLPHKKLFDLTCKQLRTNLQRLGQKLSKTPKDPYSFLNQNASIEVLAEKKRENSNKVYYKVIMKYIYH